MNLCPAVLDTSRLTRRMWGALFEIVKPAYASRNTQNSIGSFEPWDSYKMADHQLLTVAPHSNLIISDSHRSAKLTSMADIMAIPVTHFLGPIGYAMTERYGYDHPPVTLGMILAQAISEASEYQAGEDGAEYESNMAVSIDFSTMEFSITD